MKAKKTLKRLTGMIAAFAFAISLCAPVVGIVANAADVIKVENFASQSVTEDLSDMDLSVYPINDKGFPQVIRAQEYCYSENATIAKHYGLYLYIYNPTARTLMNQCHVNMAVDYNQSGNPSSYENVQLEICNFSEDKLFYKFKVKDAQRLYDVAKEYAAENLDERRYDIAGITLVYSDATKITDDTVSKTYRFEGYAKGCGKDQTAESTLTCTAEGLETIHLSINHTNYIAETPSDGNFIYDQVHTAYFSIPEEYFEEGGELQKIKAEWYEYKTAPIFVTWDLDAYEALMPYVGETIWDKCEDLRWRVLWDQLDMRVEYYINRAFNKNVGDTYIHEWGCSYNFRDAEYLPRMSLLFFREKNNRYVSSSDLIKEMKRGRFQSEKLVNGYPFEYFSDIGVAGLEGAFEDLGVSFMNKIDENRIPYLDNPSDGCGYVSRTADAEDSSFIKFENPDQGWWDERWHGVDYQTSSFAPIQTLTKDELGKVKSKDFGEKYYVNEEEEDVVYEYCKKETNAGNRAVLFRFAKTDYYASAARFDKVGNGMSAVDGYVAQQTVFLDFDILSLTFRVEGRLDNVMPVVSDPVDIVPSIDASDDVFEQNKPNNPFAGIGDIFDNIGGGNSFKEKLKIIGWTIGACAIVAGGVGIYFLVKKSKDGKGE